MEIVSVGKKSVPVSADGENSYTTVPIPKTKQRLFRIGLYIATDKRPLVSVTSLPVVVAEVWNLTLSRRLVNSEDNAVL